MTTSGTPPGPIFLAGVDRSGIGLLGELLERHHAIAMSRRTNWFRVIHGQFGDLADAANLDRCLAAIGASERLGRLDPEPDRIRGEWPAIAPKSYGALFELLHRHNLERTGRTRWGDKSLGSEAYADVIFADYPDAVMVHVLRDPRDRYASQAGHRKPGRGGAGAGAALWRWSERLARQHCRRWPDRYLVVRYEDLVGDPAATLATVFGVVGEALTEDVTTAELHTRSIGRHRRDLTRAEIGFMDLVLGSAMDRRDYEHATAPRAARMTGPLGLARLGAGMALWRPGRTMTAQR